MNDERRRAVEARMEQILDTQIHEATSVRGIWLIYHAAAMPRGAGPVQQSECRRAFYAGAAALLELVIRCGNPEMPTDVGELMIERLQLELAQFARQVQAGNV